MLNKIALTPKTLGSLFVFLFVIFKCVYHVCNKERHIIIQFIQFPLTFLLGVHRVEMQIWAQLFTCILILQFNC